MNYAHEQSLTRDDTKTTVWIVIALGVFLLSAILAGAAYLS